LVEGEGEWESREALGWVANQYRGFKEEPCRAKDKEDKEGRSPGE
jgi:hypothetical protein